MAQRWGRVGVVVAMAVVATTCSYGQQPAPETVYRTPVMKCTSDGRLVHCTISDTGNLRVRWTFYTDPAFKTEGKEFNFEATSEWTVVEAAITDSEDSVIRVRAEVKIVHDKAMFREYIPN